MTCDGDWNSAILMSARPALGLRPHAVCNAVVCLSASHLSRLIPLNPTYPAQSH